MDGQFLPASFLADPHLQTIWGPVVRRAPKVAMRAEVWETTDGDVLDVELLQHRPGRPGVLVLHGMEGSSRAPYVLGVMAELDRLGWNAAALNFRTCGPTPARGPRAYHSGETEDAGHVVRRLRERWNGEPLGAVGFSLGGNVLLKWLAEQGERAPLDAAVAISVPFNLAACAARLDGGGFWSAIYRLRFMRSLRRKAFRVARTHPGLLNEKAVRRAWSFRAFDDAVTAPLHGFQDAADYWARCSGEQFLPAIRRPTLLASAEDDPFIPATAIPREVIARNPHLTAWIQPHGGHVGFVAGAPWRPVYAVERAAVAFLGPRLEPINARARASQG